MSDHNIPFIKGSTPKLIVPYGLVVPQKTSGLIDLVMALEDRSLVIDDDKLRRPSKEEIQIALRAGRGSFVEVKNDLLSGSCANQKAVKKQLKDQQERDAIKMYAAVSRTVVAMLRRQNIVTASHSMMLRYLLEYFVFCISQSNKKHGIVDYVREKIHTPWFQILLAGAGIHDVGKTVPDILELVVSPKRLSEEQFEVIKRHPYEGVKILEEASCEFEAISYYGISIFTLAAELHHAWYNGKGGYPRGLKGDELPLIAQLLAICDVFEALMSKRSYKASVNADETLKIIMMGSGTQFNPFLVKIFAENYKGFCELHQYFTNNADILFSEVNDNTPDINIA